MARPYSMDLRERVVTAVENGGASCHTAAARFGIGVSTAIRWLDRHRRTGSTAPGQMGGHKPRKIAGEHRDWLLVRCRSGGFTLRGLVAELAQRGLNVDYRSVWAFVHDEGFSVKKPSSPANKIDPISRGGAGSGAYISNGLTLPGWFSSTGRGPRQTWRRCGDGRRLANGCQAKSRMVTGTR